MGFYGCIPRFLKKNATWILTALGLGGFVGTTVLVASETPKVTAKINEERVNKLLETGRVTDLTIREKAEIVIPGYLPAILLGLVTAGCFVGAQILNVKQQAVLLGAYGLAMKEFDAYRGEVRGAMGEEKEKALYLAAQKKVQALEGEIAKLKEENGPFFYSLATLPGWRFEMKPQHVANAIMHFNRNLTLRGEAPLSELYSFLGIPKHAYNQDDADEYGWDTYANSVDFGCFYQDFRIREIITENGQPLRLIDMDIPPYKLGMKYGDGDYTGDNLYPGYQPDETIDRAPLKKAEKTDPPDIYVPGMF